MFPPQKSKTVPSVEKEIFRKKKIEKKKLNLNIS